MATIAIIYGSSTGNTRDASHKLYNALGQDAADLIDVRDATLETFASYPAFIFAVSTWGAGDLQDDWEEFFATMDEVDLSGKRVAVMGLGDQRNYPDTFADAAAILAEKAHVRGAILVGKTKAEEYEYSASRAEQNGELVGLIIDEDSQSNLTDARLNAWVETLKPQLASESR